MTDRRAGVVDMRRLARRIGTVLAVMALGLVLAHEANAFAPHHEDGDHHCCLCDAAIGLAPAAAPLVRPELVVALPAPADQLLAAPVLLHADASRAPPISCPPTHNILTCSRRCPEGPSWRGFIYPP
jgi:hypothetical protein